MVSMYAMGSLLPLSNSSMGLRFSLRFIFCERSRLNTDAESVEDIVAASRRQVSMGISMFMSEYPESQKMKPPVSSVVSRTPTVESIIPCAMTGLMSRNLVSIPPVNRMMLRAIMPINWASSALSNSRPRPSVPKPMPTSRKSNKVGIPNR